MSMSLCVQGLTRPKTTTLEGNDATWKLSGLEIRRHDKQHNKKKHFLYMDSLSEVLLK
jgi:hypothetical protein